MTTIDIKVCRNGYTAREGLSNENPISPGSPYVFETWDSLILWLKFNLDKPLESVRDCTMTDAASQQAMAKHGD